MPEKPKVKRLIATIPERFPEYGGSRLRDFLTVELPVLEITWDSGKAAIPDAVWQGWLNKLSRDKDGNRLKWETSQRYRRLLMYMAEAWLEHKLITTLPQMKVSPQHARKQTVRVDKLETPFSDYLRVVSHLVDELCGKGAALVPGSLAENREAISGLLLILSGILTERPGMVLAALTRSDINLHPGMPLCLPRAERRGFIWLGLPSLTRLLLFAQLYRIQGEPSDALFTTRGGTLTRRIRAYLDSLCISLELPVITIPNLSAHLRLHLRQCLSNTHLAVMAGQIANRTMPTDQVAGYLGIYPDDEQTIEQAANDDGQDETDQDEDYPDGDDRLMGALDRILGELRPGLRALFDGQPAGIDVLERFIKKNRSPNTIVHQNLWWLVEWLLIRAKKANLKPGSLETYTYAALRVMREFPHLYLTEIDTQALVIVLEGEYAASTRKGTKSAWRDLREYLIERNENCTLLDFDKIRINRDHRPVRVLSMEDIKALVKMLSGDVMGWAVAVSYLCRLRVSEVCRIRASDWKFVDDPYLLVPPSKRGIRRRVSLAHLTPEQIQALEKRQKKRLKESGPTAPFFLDTDGQPLTPKRVSERSAGALKSLGLIDPDHYGIALRHHSLRAAGAQADFYHLGDVRYAASQLGHALAMTTTGSYLAALNMEAVVMMASWRTPLNRSGMHLPVKTLAVLVDMTDRAVENWIDRYNQERPEEPIQRQIPDELPDGPRPGRSGRTAHYLSVDDALGLVRWQIVKGS